MTSSVAQMIRASRAWDQRVARLLDEIDAKRKPWRRLGGGEVLRHRWRCLGWPLDDDAPPSEGRDPTTGRS